MHSYLRPKLARLRQQGTDMKQPEISFLVVLSCGRNRGQEQSQYKMSIFTYSISVHLFC